MKKLETATNNTKSWKHKVAEHEGLLRLIEPGNCSTRIPVIIRFQVIFLPHCGNKTDIWLHYPQSHSV